MAETTSTKVSYGLTGEEVEQFHRDGFYGPFDLYEPGEIEAKLWEIRPKLIDSRLGVYSQDKAMAGVTNLASYDRHLDVDLLSQHVTRPEIVDKLTSILGPDVLCWRSEFFAKYPGDEGTDWHQTDNFANVGTQPQLRWPEDSPFGGALTVWTAFTEATVENGCLQVMLGTHDDMYYDDDKIVEYDDSIINQHTKQGVKRGFFGYDYRKFAKDPNWYPDESRAKSVVLRQGQAVMFWSTLMHASHPHEGKTKQMRLGYVARYVPTSVGVYPDMDHIAEFGGEARLDKFGCVLVAGNDRYGHNTVVDHTINGTPFAAPR